MRCFISVLFTSVRVSCVGNFRDIVAGNAMKWARPDRRPETNICIGPTMNFAGITITVGGWDLLLRVLVDIIPYTPSYQFIPLLITYKLL